MKNIEFFSTVAGVAEVAPVIEAKKFTLPWFNTCKEDYVNLLKENDGGTFFHVYRCPGIFDLYNHGYILTAWCDIQIETNGDGQGFKWTLPNSDLMDVLQDANNTPIVATHSFQQIPVPPNTLKTIIKINTPWHIIAPKGMKFLINPIAYSDNAVFTNATGILDPSIASEMNFQLYWHLLNGKHTIKAGTPIAHLIPITEDKLGFKCRDANAHDLSWIKKRKYLMNFAFMLRRPFIKKSYEKHFESKCPFSRFFK